MHSSSTCSFLMTWLALGKYTYTHSELRKRLPGYASGLIQFELGLGLNNWYNDLGLTCQDVQCMPDLLRLCRAVFANSTCEYYVLIVCLLIHRCGPPLNRFTHSKYCLRKVTTFCAAVALLQWVYFLSNLSVSHLSSLINRSSVANHQLSNTRSSWHIYTG